MSIISSILNGVNERETRVAILSPTFKSVFPTKSSPIFSTVPIYIPPEPVTGFCILPFSATISLILAFIFSTSCPASSSI